MGFKYILFIFIFLLITPLVYASETKVLYFFGSSCHFSQIEDANINELKSFWEGKVEWKDYDLDDKSNFYIGREYNVSAVPAAIVECLNKTIKIDKKDNYFSQQINETINQCQSGEIVKEVETNSLVMVFVLVFLACLAAICLVKKHTKKKLKRRLKKKRKAK